MTFKVGNEDDCIILQNCPLTYTVSDGAGVCAAPERGQSERKVQS